MLPRRQAKTAKRASRWKSQAHLTFVRSFHCAMPLCDDAPIEAAHVRIGSGAGMGQKPDDWRAVPLCKQHHQSQHSIGESTFWRKYENQSGQNVESLITELCDASPRRSQIRDAKKERGLA